MPVVEPSSGEIPVIPDGLYPAVISAVKEITLETPDQFGKTEKLKLSVEIEVDGDLMTLDPLLNRAWSEKAALFIVAEACGLNPNPAVAFDTDDLIDCHAQVLVETKEEGKWPRITKWTKAGQQQRKTVAPKAGPDFAGFWEAAYAIEPDKAKVGAFVGKNTNAEGVPGLTQVQLDDLLQEIKRHFHASCKHLDSKYTPDGKERVCTNCGAVLAAAE